MATLEIIALAGLWGLEGEAANLSRVRGVDTTDTVDAARDAAIALARYTGGAVVVSGKVDLIARRRDREPSPTAAARSCPRSPAAVARRAACWPCTPALPIRLRQPSAVPPSTTSLARVPPPSPMPRQALKVAFIDELYRASAQDIASNQLDLGGIRPCPSPQPIPA